MKINSTSLGYLVTLLAFGLQEITGLAVTTFSCNRKAEPNKMFNITCSITGTLVNGIQWTRPDGTQVTACSDATTCGTLVPGYTITTATSAENVLKIANMGASDRGNWTCQDGPDGDEGCEIFVQKIPTSSLTILSTQSTYSVGDTLEVSVDVQDYYCSRPPSFHLLLDSQKVELDTLPSTPSTILSGTQSKSITVTEDMTGSIKLVFNCRDDIVLPGEKRFTITAPSTTPSTPVTTTTTTTVTTTTTTSTSTATATENNTAITTITTTGTTTTPLPIPIYGIVIIAVVVFIILLVAIIFCVRKCRGQNENNREEEMYDVPSRTEPQDAVYLNLTNQKTGANNQEEGSYTSSKVNPSQMTVADDPVQDNPLPGGRSEVGMLRM